MIRDTRYLELLLRDEKYENFPIELLNFLHLIFYENHKTKITLYDLFNHPLMVHDFGHLDLDDSGDF